MWPHDIAVGRRRLLTAGSAGLVGLSLADLLRGETGSPAARRRSIINVHLDGGPPQMDFIDMKPHGPAEVRGEFAPIAGLLDKRMHAPVYTVAMIDIGHRHQGVALVSATAVLVMSYTAGGVLAPALGAAALQWAPVFGFPALLIVIASAGLWRLMRAKVNGTL